jgi:16S rRNA (uracil1498-N3)-methyltransferase
LVVNLLLFDDADLEAADLVRVEGPRADHVRKVLGKAPGDTLRVGRLGGQLGTGTISSDDGRAMTLHVTLSVSPPPKHPRVVVLALPRPPVLRRLLEHVTAMGVEHVALVHTARVEKSYWQTPSLEVGAIETHVRSGLAQACDTIAPRVSMHRRFRPFVEDELPGLREGACLLVADPTATRACPTDVLDPVIIVFGPEGGLVPFELELLRARGAVLVGLGPRTLRVETAVVAALGRLGPTLARGDGLGNCPTA